MTHSNFKRLAILVVACVLGAPVAAEAKSGRGHGPSNAPGLQKRTLDGPRPAAGFAERGAVDEQPAEDAPVVALPSVEPPAGDDAAPARKAKKTKAAKGKKKGHVRKATFVLRGTVVEVDEEQGTVVVDVEGGNKRGRRFRGEEVTVDVSAAKLTDGDEEVALEDVIEGDEVIVQARLPKTTYAGDVDVIAARRMVVLIEDELDEDEAEEQADEPSEPAPVVPVEPAEDPAPAI